MRALRRSGWRFGGDGGQPEGGDFDLPRLRRQNLSANPFLLIIHLHPSTKMKTPLPIIFLLLTAGAVAHGQFTSNLVIDGSALGLTHPVKTNGTLQDLGPFAILDYTTSASGTVSLNFAFANSGAAGVGDWGDALDAVGATVLSTAVDGTFGIRIYGVNPSGANHPIKSNEDMGIGVGGLNSSRMDWGSAAGSNSEGLRIEITTTGLPTTVKLVVTGLQFGNANAIGEALPEALVGSLVNLTGIGGSLGPIAVSTSNQDFALPGGGLSILGGGGTENNGSFVITQATQPGTGSVGFSLQGISVDVVAVAVPEPSTVALFMGLGVAGLAMWRRRRLA